MIKTDRSMQLHVLFLIVSAPLLHFFFAPFSVIEYTFMLFAYGILFITELQNSALETMIDRLHPERHESIRDSKDIAAGSVLMGLIIFTGFVLLLSIERGAI